jgi:rhamnosyltransferase
LDISVIIRTRNESQWIGHCIQSLIDNFKKPEIIIIDHNSTDQTVEIINDFKEDKNLNSSDGSYTNIKVYDISKYSPGLALNLGATNSSNENILIISAHCVINELNNENLVKNFKNYNCFYGNQIPIYRGKKIKKRYIWSNFIDKSCENFYSDQENRYFLHNAFAFYNRKFLIENPFDESLSGKEDRYWVNKIIQNNHKVLYDPSLSVFHHYTLNGATWKGIG